MGPSVGSGEGRRGADLPDARTEINPELLDVHAHLTEALRRVRVNQNIPFGSLGGLGDGRQVLHSPDLVI